MMKKRWIGLLVENEIGVLARISGLFAAKAYNLDSLTVGTTEDKTISRMTIGLISDENTFEQVKKQLNRSVEVIKVFDYTDTAMHRKELMFVKIKACSDQELIRLSFMREAFGAKLVDCNASAVLLECVQVESKNDEFIRLLAGPFAGRIEVVRGGSIAVESF